MSTGCQGSTHSTEVLPWNGPRGDLALRLLMHNPFPLVLKTSDFVRGLERNALVSPVSDWASQGEMLGQATSWLDGIYRQLANGGDVQAGMMTLHHGLFHLRRQWSRKDWRKF